MLPGRFLFDVCLISPYIYIYKYIYSGEIKMYFYLAMVGFEPTPTSTAAPSNCHTLSATTLLKKGVIMAEVYA